MTVALTSFQLVPCTHELVDTPGFQLVFQLVRLVKFGLYSVPCTNKCNQQQLTNNYYVSKFVDIAITDEHKIVTRVCTNKNDTKPKYN